MPAVPMDESEVTEVSQLLCSSYAALGEMEGLSPDQTEWLCQKRGSESTVRRESQAERYLVAKERGQIVGMVAVAGDRITKLYVSPNRTGQGVGRSLYEDAETLIRGSGHTHVRLGAFPTAVPFYERMGLSVVGERAATGPLEGRKMMLMEKALDHETG
jgi:GNAT superfamily N-acetyltransferase